MSRRALGTIKRKQADVITTRGDVVRGSSTGLAERLAVGTNGQLLGSDGTDASWGGAGILDTEQATTSGATIDFTSIPNWVKKITVMFVGVSTTGTSQLILQIGDSGGIETSGYLGGGTDLTAGVNTTTNTDGFLVTRTTTAASVWHGAAVLNLEDSSDFTWVCTGVLARSDAAAVDVCAGTKALSAALDRIRITTAGGAETFDAGAINILYE